MSARSGEATVTRLSRTSFFQELEQRWAEAIKQQDKEVLDKEFLADDYALRISDDTSREIHRSDWLAAIPIYNTRNFTIKNLEVREFGNVAVVSHSFYQEADVNGVDRSGNFFIVDVWMLREGKWKVSARYSSPSRQLPIVPKTGEGRFGNSSTGVSTFMRGLRSKASFSRVNSTI